MWHRALAGLSCLVLGCLAFALGTPACRQREGGGSPKAQAPVASAPAALGSTANSNVAPEPSRFTHDLLWQVAARGDAIDRARLAQREGAAGLLEGFGAGGSVALTALAALPHAQDAELALPTLCHFKGTAPPKLELLRAIQGVCAHVPEQREPLAPRARADCLRALERLQREPGLDPERFDLVSSSAEMLREHWRTSGR